jgi:E3 ubiquitin-protein ligase SHPRH
VYEGWKAIQKGVLAQQASHNKAAGRVAEDRKRKAFDALRKKTVKKYSSRSGAVAREEEPEEDVQLDASGDPISLLDMTQTGFEKYVRAHDIVITTYQDCRLPYVFGERRAEMYSGLRCDGRATGACTVQA